MVRDAVTFLWIDYADVGDFAIGDSLAREAYSSSDCPLAVDGAGLKARLVLNLSSQTILMERVVRTDLGCFPSYISGGRWWVAALACVRSWLDTQVAMARMSFPLAAISYSNYVFVLNLKIEGRGM